MNKKTLLIISESIDVEDSSGSKCNVALITNLSKAGFNITVLHYTRRTQSLEGVTAIGINERKWHPLFFLGKLQTILYRWLKLDIGWAMQHIFGFSFTFFNDGKSIANALQNYNPDDFEMIWTLSKGNSYRTHKGLLLSPEWHSKWYAYIHDPYPSHLYPRPFNYVHAGYKQKHVFFDAICKNAKHVVLPSQLLKDWMESYFPSIENKSIIIPHQTTDKILKEAILPEVFDENNFNVLLAGNLLSIRDPKPLVEAFSLFLKNYPEAREHSKLLIIGNTKGFDAYLEGAKKDLSQLYVSEGHQPFDMVLKMQYETTVNVILEAKSEISPFLPGKFPHCVKANAPILHIGPYFSETGRLLGDVYPFQHQNDDVEGVAHSLSTLYDKWEKGEPLHLGRKDLEHYLSALYLKEVLT